MYITMLYDCAFYALIIIILDHAIYLPKFMKLPLFWFELTRNNKTTREGMSDLDVFANLVGKRQLHCGLRFESSAVAGRT